MPTKCETWENNGGQWLRLQLFLETKRVAKLIVCTQRAHSTTTTSLLCRKDAKTSFWHYNDNVIIAPCARCVHISVAVNYPYRRYKSIWKFRPIIDMHFSILIYRVSNLTSAIMGQHNLWQPPTVATYMDSEVPWVRVRTKELWLAHAN